MKEDNKLRSEEVRGQADRTPEVNSFDNLAMGLAEGTFTRGQALKYMGVALLGGLGAMAGISVFADDADAKRRRGKKRKKPQQQQQQPGFKPAGARCQTSAECGSQQTKRICEVAVNASNSDKTCCGGAGATCGPKNGDGDDTAPFCCVGFSCNAGVCQPVPDDV